ncbi:MAG: hypothetical protein QF662_05475, partial [Phycisphaerae bacterium]|nr:hypothetical protein [Phycisphaerae bacterium]
HSRLAYCFCCVALVMLGIALALVCEGSHFLVPFAVGIGPAVGTVVLTDLGKRLAETHPKNPQDFVFLIWLGGFIVLVASIGLMVRQLRR